MTKLSGGALTGKCSVVSVRDGQETSAKSSKIHGKYLPQSVHSTMYVDVRC